MFESVELDNVFSEQAIPVKSFCIAETFRGLCAKDDVENFEAQNRGIKYKVLCFPQTMELTVFSALLRAKRDIW